MTASNHGLHYVSYPVVVLIKSSKLIPTMVVGFLVERKRYSLNEWTGAACITFGIIVFHLSQHWSTNDDNSSDEENKVSSSSSSSLFGLALLVGSLAMDGLLGSCQGLLKKERSQYRRPDAMETMMYLNLYAIVFLLPTALYTGHWKNGIDLLLLELKQQPRNYENSEFISSLLLINGTAAVGQIFVFFTIHLYSPLMCTTITTTRKFITVLLSVYRFGHVFSTTQWSCVALVFGGVYMEIISKVSSPKKTKLH
jgi:UDP-galactose transporter B1